MNSVLSLHGSQETKQRICSIKRLSFGNKDYTKELKNCRVYKSRKENPQKLTQLNSRSHPRHLVGKRTAQKDTIIDITSDSQVNSNSPVCWVSLASFGQLGLISDPQVFLKLQNGINDPKGLENKIYNMMKGW